MVMYKRWAGSGPRIIGWAREPNGRSGSFEATDITIPPECPECNQRFTSIISARGPNETSATCPKGHTVFARPVEEWVEMRPDWLIDE